MTTLITEGFGSIIQGVGRDDSGTLLRVMKGTGHEQNPLIGCESGLVHLYGPYFHWGCGQCERGLTIGSSDSGSHLR